MISRRIVWAAAVVSVVLMAWLAGARDTPPTVVRAALEPLTVPATTALGGVVAEVCVRRGDAVRAAQVLVRFESAKLRTEYSECREALRAVNEARLEGEAIGRIPPRFRAYATESHPEVVAAESLYVEALRALEKAPENQRASARTRLKAAGATRMRARQRIGRALGSGVPQAELEALKRTIQHTLSGLADLLEKADVRAPSGGVVDILDVHPGDKFLPGSPVALLVVPGEYSASFSLPPHGRTGLRAGTLFHGTMLSDGRSFAWRVDSIAQRTVPMSLRDRPDAGEQTVVHASVALAGGQGAGVPQAEFQLP